MANMNSTICVGVFYENENKQIVRTYGCDQTHVSYLHYNGKEIESGRCPKQIVVNDWIHRPDIIDYPNYPDKKLPYVFDLFWDLKRESEIKDYEPDDEEFFKEKLIECNLLHLW